MGTTIYQSLFSLLSEEQKIFTRTYIDALKFCRSLELLASHRFQKLNHDVYHQTHLKNVVLPQKECGLYDTNISTKI